MKVCEMFYSIEGEGIRAGLPAIFIRLSGCNLRCTYCDTPYHSEGEEVGIERIISSMQPFYPCKRVTLTGGEPLIHPGIEELVRKLLNREYEVNIETNGSVPLERFVLQPGVIITMDYKCPGSGEESRMYLPNLSLLRREDVLKFVVESDEDLERAEDIISDNQVIAHTFISPVFGKIDPAHIAEFIQEHGMVDTRVQVQLHKVLWDPSVRGV